MIHGVASVTVVTITVLESNYSNTPLLVMFPTVSCVMLLSAAGNAGWRPRIGWSLLLLQLKY